MAAIREPYGFVSNRIKERCRHTAEEGNEEEHGRRRDAGQDAQGSRGTREGEGEEHGRRQEAGGGKQRGKGWHMIAR